MGQRQSKALMVAFDEDPFAFTLDETISEAADWLSAQQAADGHWVFELEADATIPAEYILLNHFLGDINDPVEVKLAHYLRRTQGADGGWPLFLGGEMDLSASVKAYLALKLIGDDIDAPHMRRAREAILAGGGAARANVFTRFALALFGEVPWRAVPVMRVEAMLLPMWAPFNVFKVSYWSRTVMIPMFILGALKPRAVNPRDVHVPELFTEPPENVRTYCTNPTGHWLGDIMLRADSVGRLTEPFMPRFVERVAIKKALAFIRERFNEDDGLGGIFPAIANTMMALHALGFRHDDPEFIKGRRAADRLLVMRKDEAYCQPCQSPVWDTALALHALMEAGESARQETIDRGCTWLVDRQILAVEGDWKAMRPNLRPGGWAFFYHSDYYPDVDDTAVVVMALDRADRAGHAEAIARGVEWILGMQSRNGGWGAFDADNDLALLNHVPFADHGALLDPPTVDVTARCLGMLAQCGYNAAHPGVARAIAYLKQEQESDGSWFGRWGTNYIYGTWSVLNALNVIGEDMQAPYIRRAVDWLMAVQRADGGWGEDCATYWPERRGEAKASTPSQTAWALLALMAAGEAPSNSVRRGVHYLLTAPRHGGKWHETLYNAVGFPRVFYLHYYGYSAFFPLWALARYRSLTRGDAERPMYGI